MKTTYLSTQQVLAIHCQMIKRFRGSQGVRDSSLTEPAVGKTHVTIDGQDLYINIINKATALLQLLLKNHPFIDGNKRTALTSTGIFLGMNGYKLKNNHEEKVEFAISVANDLLSTNKLLFG